MKSKRNRIIDILKPTCNGSSETLADQVMEIMAKKKKEVVFTSLEMSIKAWWLKHCEDNDKECNWDYRYSSALKDIIKKLRCSIKVKKGTDADDTEVQFGFETLANKLPDFYKNADLTTINNKYDSILNQIKSTMLKGIKTDSQINRMASAVMGVKA